MSNYNFKNEYKPIEVNQNEVQLGTFAPSHIYHDMYENTNHRYPLLDGAQINWGGLTLFGVNFSSYGDNGYGAWAEVFNRLQDTINELETRLSALENAEPISFTLSANPSTYTNLSNGSTILLTANGLPSGKTVTWTATPSNSNYWDFQTDGNSATVSLNYSEQSVKGTVSIRSIGEGSGYVTLKADFAAGQPISIDPLTINATYNGVNASKKLTAKPILPLSQGTFRWINPSTQSNTNISIEVNTDDYSICTVRNSSTTNGASGVIIQVSNSNAERPATWSGTISAAPLKVISVTGITLIDGDGNNVSESEIQMATIDDTTTLTATVSPSNATNKNVTWTSSNTRCVNIVPNGNTCTITAINTGTSKITCTAQDGSGTKVACTVNCTWEDEPATVKVTGITLDKSEIKMDSIGNITVLTATVSPSNATNKNVTWSLSGDSCVDIEPNNNKCGIKSANFGKATITCTAQDGSGTKATCDVKCIRPTTVQVTGITLIDDDDNNVSESKIEMVSIGDIVTLTATVSPSNATNKNVKWTSSNGACIDIEPNGNTCKITATDYGTSIITCTAQDGSGKKVTCTVKCIDNQPVNQYKYYWGTEEINLSQLESQGTSVDTPINKITNTLNLLPENVFAYFIYPKSWGKATLLDNEDDGVGIDPYDNWYPYNDVKENYYIYSGAHGMTQGTEINITYN